MTLNWALLLQEVEEIVPPAHAGGSSARTVTIVLMVLLPAISTAMVIFGGLRLKGILKRIPKISSKSHLDTLRAEHKLHGTMALLIRVLLGISSVLFFIDLWILDGPLTDLFYSIGPSLLSILISMPFRKIEAEINELPCATEELREEWVAIRQG